jgi:hypothetical protein
VQWEAFNEEDMVSFFDPAEIIAYIAQLDQTRLIDTDSGGPANNLYIGDVNDMYVPRPWCALLIHLAMTIPTRRIPSPAQRSMCLSSVSVIDSRRYAMIGEFGGIGAFIMEKVIAYRPPHCFIVRLGVGS